MCTPVPFRDLSELPPEIVEMIVFRITKNDLTACVRVSLGWHRQLVDHLWHTFEHNFGNYNNVIAMYNDYINRRAKSSWARNAHRVRTLKLSSVLDDDVMVALIRVCWKSEELHVDGNKSYMPDSDLAKLITAKSISRSSRNSQNYRSNNTRHQLYGWKTLGFVDTELGNETMEAILKHSATLENLRIDQCPTFPSEEIQRLLCSAPKLKRFDMIPWFTDSRDWGSYLFLASSIFNSTENWVCLELESFKCMIGVPRPDIYERTNGRPFSSRDNDGLDFTFQYTMQKSRAIQKVVLEQLGRLTKLRELTLGLDNSRYEDYRFEPDTEGRYHDPDLPQMGLQYACLTMTLEDGLSQLKDLKSLRRLHLEKMNHSQGVKEREWMKENWPNYGKDSRDTFWTERGHTVNVSFYHGKRTCDDRSTYDWW
ncbi:hypothetical protein BG000_002441 [Podila horticola]|nr:hypothetical protein BG000_002441 [Podila horticola]